MQYGVRVYVPEPALAGNFQMPGYYGNGVRACLSVWRRIGKKLECGLQLNNTLFYGDYKKYNGSGYQHSGINNTDPEFFVQVRANLW